MLEIVSCAKSAIASACDDRNPLLWILGKIIEHLRQFLISRGMQRIHDLWSVNRHNG
jgi:hypothetical protein